MPADSIPELMTTTRAEVFALLAEAERRGELRERGRCLRIVARHLSPGIDLTVPSPAADAHLTAVAISAAIRHGDDPPVRTPP